mmetsp:Transcript_10301/g.24714  ORF Transcript_10301/g.24714 Transcript_10301/m.24714 type:complete len:269 (+) Transcript_10301:1522-2328(+)
MASLVWQLASLGGGCLPRHVTSRWRWRQGKFTQLARDASHAGLATRDSGCKTTCLAVGCGRIMFWNGHPTIKPSHCRKVPAISQDSPLGHSLLPSGSQQVLLQVSNSDTTPSQDCLNLRHLLTDQLMLVAFVREPNCRSCFQPRQQWPFPPIRPIPQRRMQFHRFVQGNVPKGPQRSFCQLRGRFRRRIASAGNLTGTCSSIACIRIISSIRILSGWRTSKKETNSHGRTGFHPLARVGSSWSFKDGSTNRGRIHIVIFLFNITLAPR